MIALSTLAYLLLRSPRGEEKASEYAYEKGTAVVVGKEKKKVVENGKAEEEEQEGEEGPSCAYCGAQEVRLLTCACRTAAYCNKEHQNADWSRHADACRAARGLPPKTKKGKKKKKKKKAAAGAGAEAKAEASLASATSEPYTGKDPADPGWQEGGEEVPEGYPPVFGSPGKGAGFAMLVRKHLTPYVWGLVKEDAVGAALATAGDDGEFWVRSAEAYRGPGSALLLPLAGELHGVDDLETVAGLGSEGNSWDVAQVAEVSQKGNPDLAVISLETRRNFGDLPFPSGMDGSEMEELVSRVATALGSGWTRVEEGADGWDADLVANHLVPPPLSEGMVRTGYGASSACVFVMAPELDSSAATSETAYAAVWVGGEDHVRVVVVRRDGDFPSAMVLSASVLVRLSAQTPFATHPYLGHLTASPRMLGTGLVVRAIVATSALDKKMVKSIASKYGLRVRKADPPAVPTPASSSSSAHYAISNRVTMGLSPATLVLTMCVAVGEVIQSDSVASMMTS